MAAGVPVDGRKQHGTGMPCHTADAAHTDLLARLQRLGVVQHIIIWLWIVFMTSPEHRVTVFTIQFVRFGIKLLFHPSSALFIPEPGTSSVTAPNPVDDGSDGSSRQSTSDLLTIGARLLTNDVVTLATLYADGANVHNPGWLGFYVNILGPVMAFKNPMHAIGNVVLHIPLSLWCLWAMGAPWQVVCNAGVLLVMFGLYCAILLIGLRKSREQVLRGVDKQKLYLARIAHELRTPLTGILGIITLLRAELGMADDDVDAATHTGRAASAPESTAAGDSSFRHRSLAAAVEPGVPAREPLLGLTQTLTECTRSLLAIANDVLDASKIEAEMLTLCNSPTDLVALGTELKHLAMASVLTLRRQRPMDSPVVTVETDFTGLPQTYRTVNADGQRIRQVLLNLLNNAAKFTERGRIRLAISLVAPPTPLTSGSVTQTYRFSVRDSGCGLTPATRARLFEPFSQGSDTVSGTGLGLYITKRLVQAFGGVIDAHPNTEWGVGSHFTVDLPLDVHVPVPPGNDGETLAVARGYRTPGGLLGQSSLPVVASNQTCSSQPLPDISLRDDGVQSGGPALSRLRSHLQSLAVTSPFAGYTTAVPGPPEGAVASVAAPARTPLAVATCTSLTVTGPCLTVGFRPRSRSPGELPAVAPSAVTLAGEISDSPTTTITGTTRPSTLTESHSCGPSPASGVLNASSHPQILIVDDHIVNLKVIEKMILHLGYRCDTANNGEEAVVLASRTPYKLILMDCQMPVLDGFAATQRIRSAPGCVSRGAWIVALTAAATTDRDQMLAAGMDQHCLKPVTLPVLRQIVQRLR